MSDVTQTGTGAAAQPNSFRTIKTEILRRIRDRVWQPGELIPGEEDLAREFGCARVTVNRALRELADIGIVERKRRVGTRIAEHPLREARLEIPVVRTEVEARGAQYRFSVLSRDEVEVPETLRARLELPPGAPVLHVRCLHFADNRPWQFEDRWINLAAVPDIAGQSFETVSPNEWLVRNAPFSEMENDLSAAGATTEEAEMLGVSRGDPVFVIERATWLLDQPITLVRMVHPSSYRMISRV
ncbi:GntR family transcriptional regulator [Stappia taiwanensis]|nr:UTRA domain-containing protein [Stappia taiwanensis]GGE88902.1 GntR family transcriptional regulator [Stappia taiwanensis]